MKHLGLAFVIVFLMGSSLAAFADGKKVESNGTDSKRDLNLFQAEPSVINEHFYTSGQVERHQSVGKVLPYGAEIPDNNAPDVVAPLGLEKSQAERAAAPISTFGRKTKRSSPALERRLSTAAAERHQFVGNTLPPGAAIPDNK